MSKTFVTKKGTNIPLMNLKGKDYMMVAYRIQWFTEEEQRFSINTDFLVLTDDQTVCRAVINTFNNEGQIIRTATGSKRETKKDFPDHTEKAETGAIGRALVELGYGTQFAIADMDEGARLADSPLSAPAKNYVNTTQVYTSTADTKAILGVSGALQAQSNLAITGQTLNSVCNTTLVAASETLQPLKRSSFNKKKDVPKEVPATVGEQPGEPQW